MGETDICELGFMLTKATTEMYDQVLDRFGRKLTGKFLADKTQEERNEFIKRMKDAQTEALRDRLTVIMNRVLTDHYFIKSYNQIMEPYKSLEELRRDNEIANNHLQSIENERFILQRDTDMAIDKLESVCEAILEHRIVKNKT